MTTVRRRVLVLGLDGADWGIIDPLLDDGLMPALRSLIDGGARSPLTSCVPPLSAPAWITFMLGTGPGTHGITDFVDRDARLYAGGSGHVTTSHDFVKETLFDAAGWAGRRVASIAVPMTYPSWPVEGVLVSGGFVPGGRMAVSPPELLDRLDVGRLNLGAGNKVLMYPLERRAEAMDLQLDRYGQIGRRVVGLERFDLTMAVVHTPDTAHHCFWPTDGTPPFRDPWIRHFHQRVDRYIEDMLSLDAWDLVVVMSDHGGGPRPVRKLAVNRWLSDLGLLRFGSSRPTLVTRAALRVKERNRRLVRLVRTRAPRAVNRAVSAVTHSATAIDWRSTSAYGSHLFQPFYGVELNVGGRQPEGVVDPNDVERVRDGVVDRLTESARRLDLPVAAVLTREEAFGPQADPRLPDIVLRVLDDVEGVPNPEGAVVVPNPPPGAHDSRAYHAQQGIMVLAGDGVRRGREARAQLQDVAPTVLSYLGVPLPAAMTGRPLEESFEPGWLSVQRAAPGGRTPATALDGSAQGVSEQEEAQMIEALRGLGYLE